MIFIIKSKENMVEYLHFLEIFDSKKNSLEIALQMYYMQLDKELNIFQEIIGCLSQLIITCQIIDFVNQQNLLKHVMLKINKIIEIDTVNEFYQRQVFLIEKHSIHDSQMDQFVKAQISQQQEIRIQQSMMMIKIQNKGLKSQINNIYATNILCSRSMQILMFKKRSFIKTLKLGCESQNSIHDYKQK
ncbi:unnamed protein product [Paramecium sonneborni]|uniref:Uncharacterized protein n=1 Tax=Paramecium sonneborni TaxID=65129 RepID=A0A8S1NNV8_9CILI|nr:unnamed protein product [Paramecium sonneborni]